MMKILALSAMVAAAVMFPFAAKQAEAADAAEAAPKRQVATFETNYGLSLIHIFAEYDALPGLGHGCGHNIIAASAAGAAVGISEVIGRVSGEVLVIGCPDEEGAGGKIRLLRAGAFKGVDFVLEVHPSNKNLINRGHVACSEVKVEYEGKEAHSSIPSRCV